MIVSADTSVLIASLDADEPSHPACNRLVAGGVDISTHAIAETFAILTGGGPRRRLRPADAARLIEEQILAHVRVHALSGRDCAAMLAECDSRGARGGAVYDLLHLVAARKAGAARFVPLDLRDVQALSRQGDPAIASP